MNKEKVIEILENYSAPDNLKSVLQQSLEAVHGAQDIMIHDSNDDAAPRYLPAEHYFRGFSLRLKNPNGIARQTPGLPESVENFSRHDGLLRLTVVELDKGSSISIWTTDSDDKQIIGCLFHPEGSDARMTASR